VRVNARKKRAEKSSPIDFCLTGKSFLKKMAFWTVGEKRREKKKRKNHFKTNTSKTNTYTHTKAFKSTH
jgi:hypothetical protein